MFFGVNIIGLFFNFIGYFMMSESNINKYDYSLTPDDRHKHKFSSTTLNVNYWLDQSTRDTIQNMKKERPNAFEDFNKNMEKHVYDLTSRHCDEAKFEKKRLLSRANHFNHRPEKRQ